MKGKKKSLILCYSCHLVKIMGIWQNSVGASYVENIGCRKKKMEALGWTIVEYELGWGVG